MAETSSTRPLESALVLAIQGSADGIQAFFEAFLAGPLFVPEREQKTKLSDQPQYPATPFGLMAVQAKERVIIPAFSSPDLIAEWSGEEFSWRQLSGMELSNIIPAGWWVCVNPGCEVEKELSPWELEELRAGRDAIPELVAESLQDAPHEPITLTAVTAHELVDLKSALSEFAATRAEIQSLKLLREVPRAEESSAAPTLILSVQLSECEDGVYQHLKQELAALARQKLIGGDPIKVEANNGSGVDFSAGLFRTYPSFYESKGGKGPLGRFINYFKGLVRN